MLRSPTVDRPLPPIPKGDYPFIKQLITMAPTQRASLTLSQPPPPTEPPPPLPQQLSMSAAMVHLMSPSPQMLALLAPTSSLLNSSLQKLRPRVPRMGTAMPVLPTVTTNQNLGSSFTGKHRTTNSVDNVVSNQDSSKTNSERGSVNLLRNHSSSFKSTKSTSERKLPPIHLILSSTRNGSHGLSYDFRRLFKRYSCANERLTPISERTNGSLSPTKRLGNRSRSSSSSNCSEVTETTNLSMTWPLSRSQTDLSNKVYRSISCAADDGGKQTTWCENEKIVSCDTNPMTPILSSDLKADSPETANPTVRRSPEAEEWMQMIDSEEILRQLRSMRIVTLTAKRWRIKRRADGTRYLAIRKSSETSCCMHHDNSKTNLSTVVQIDAVESPKAHPTTESSISPVSQFTTRKPRLHTLRPMSPKPTGYNQEVEKGLEGSDENTQKPTQGIKRFSPLTTLRGNNRSSSKPTSPIQFETELNRPRRRTRRQWIDDHPGIHRFQRASSKHERPSCTISYPMQSSRLPCDRFSYSSHCTSRGQHNRQTMRDANVLHTCSKYGTILSSGSSTTSGTKLVTMLVV
ncbi:hypothetical protein PHET_00143 [Paragonimus heterotremus]|uniref:Uncharacterized protein n=1 Tax=Paragonimus heterotremus TaxID=100268 RepID=A0A8J4WVF6_9TREM|nr:hypothetical protein PHET_00143 [Paragonimus heterotremus]